MALPGLTTREGASPLRAFGRAYSLNEDMRESWAREVERAEETQQRLKAEFYARETERRAA
jgi:hypothetical protein